MKNILLTIAFLSATTAFAQYNEKEYPTRRYITNDSLLVLLNCYYDDEVSKPNPYFLPEKKKVNKTVKEKILSILKREWPDSLLRLKIAERFRYKFEYLNLEKAFEITLEKTKAVFYPRYRDIRTKSLIDTTVTLSKTYKTIYDSIFLIVYDSMALKFKKELEQAIKETRVPDEILLTAATLKIKEAILIIKQDLAATGKHYFNKEAAEIALAGLGDTAMQKKFILQHDYYIEQAYKYNKVHNVVTVLWKDFMVLALVINTQESVAKLADWMDTTLLSNTSTGDDDLHPHYAFAGDEIAPNLLWFIKNASMKEGYLKIPLGNLCTSYYDYTCLTSQQMVFLKNWLIQNKGKYEFD